MFLKKNKECRKKEMKASPMKHYNWGFFFLVFFFIYLISGAVTILRSKLRV